MLTFSDTANGCKYYQQDAINQLIFVY